MLVVEAVSFIEMAIARFARQGQRPYGVCVKMTVIGVLGLCSVFVWSTFTPSTSSLTSQRSSFADIAESVAAAAKVKNARGKDSGSIHHHKSSNLGKKDVTKEKKAESHSTQKVKTKGHEKKGRKEVAHKKGAGEDLKKKEVMALNVTRQREEEEEEGEDLEEGKEREDVVEQDEEKGDHDGDADGERNETETNETEINEGETNEEVGLNALDDPEAMENAEDTENESKSIGKGKKKLGPLFDLKALYSWKTCNVRSKYNYLPCIDIESTTGKLQGYRHHERSCPKSPPMCLVPLPPNGYEALIHWPKRKSKILYKNVEHPKLASFIKTQTWVMQSEEYLTFPQNQSEFKGGVHHYLESIEEMVPDIEWGKNIRVVLDIGCMDSSFGAALIDKDVLTLSLGLKDDLVDLAQLTLERGFTAVVTPFGTRRLPFPSGVFDAIHCGGCSVAWHSNGGKLLLEMNRILRPGGYFILSAKHDTNIDEEEAMSSLTASICWNILAHKTDEIGEVGVKIYQKPESNDIYELRRKKNPPLCKEDENPDTAWYVPMKICLHTIPSAIEQRGTEWPAEWPQRLETFPEWLSNRENLVAETEHWKSIVNKSYLIGLGIDWSTVRNIMDMKAIHGGFAAALAHKGVWVMNVVPVHAPNTLPIIYERGLVGVYHDWCEAFGTYPRSYDLLHADHLFSRLKNRCKQPVGIVVEMDRILRPGGWVIIRDKVEILDPLEVILKSLHWEIRMTFAQDKEGIVCAQKNTWRP